MTQTIICDGVCTVTIEHVISIPPFTMSMESGFKIGGAIFAVLTVAFCIRLMARVINERGTTGD